MLDYQLKGDDLMLDFCWFVNIYNWAWTWKWAFARELGDPKLYYRQFYLQLLMKSLSANNKTSQRYWACFGFYRKYWRSFYTVFANCLAADLFLRSANVARGAWRLYSYEGTINFKGTFSRKFDWVYKLLVTINIGFKGLYSQFFVVFSQLPCLVHAG